MPANNVAGIVARKPRCVIGITSARLHRAGTALRIPTTVPAIYAHSPFACNIPTGSPNRRRAWGCLAIFAGLLGGVPAAGLAADDLEPFPKAASGYRRVVIRLPAVDTPDDRRVELIFGKAMEVDCNRYGLSAQLTRTAAPGWGYEYFVLGNISGPASTLMACPADEPRRTAFVRIGFGRDDTQHRWQRDNPKRPIVVHLPHGIELHYRIWSADPQTATAVSE
jgi:ecotin